jgi:hypothetical protein
LVAGLRTGVVQLLGNGTLWRPYLRRDFALVAWGRRIHAAEQNMNRSNGRGYILLGAPLVALLKHKYCARLAL